MIIIDKELMFLEFFEADKKKIIEIDHADHGMTRYMDHIVKIERGVTVQDLFRHIYAENSIVINKVFESSLGGCDINDFMGEAMGEAMGDETLKYAFFEHICDLDIDGLKHEIRFSIMGTHPDDDRLNIKYSAELCSINSYSDVEVRIDESFDVFKGEKKVFGCTKPITLYELVSSLLYEISYHGPPADRDVVIEDMQRQMEEMDPSEYTEAETRVHPMELPAAALDEIAILESELEESIKTEDYETSAVLRDKIESLKKKKNNTNGRNKQP